ncbi:MAG: ATP-binding protein [Phycisphaerales bacterium]
MPPVAKEDSSPDIFDKRRLPAALDEFLRRLNPWWVGKPGPVLPPYRRWAFGKILRTMRSGLAPVTVVRGPRQVGKSTLQEQVIDHLIGEEGVEPTRILRVQFDDLRPLGSIELPVQTIAWWFEDRVLLRTFNESAREGKPAFLLLDEVQNLSGWAEQIKSLVDHSTVKVLVTGSSALRIEAGRDSLAGRISTIELGPLLLREVAGVALGEELPALLPDNGLEPLKRRETWQALQRHGVENRDGRDRAFSAWAVRGGYPLAHKNPDASWYEVADQLVETVVRRAIQHDLRMGERGQKRDERLLEEVFRLVCRYTGQSPRQAVFIDDIKSALDANIGWQRIQAYQRFLEGAMLLRLIPPLELRLKKKRGPAKICVCDHGLRAAWLQEVVPLDPDELQRQPAMADLAGHIAESAAGYFLSGISHLDVAHFPERGPEPEVDFVLTIGEQRIPVEIKYRRRIDQHADTRGLRAFVERTVYNAPFGVLVTMLDDVTIDDPRVVVVSLRSLLTLR